jgi:hypothetical protein
MEAVRELAAALLPQTPRLSAEATDHLFAVIPVLAASDDPEPVLDDLEAFDPPGAFGWHSARPA